MLNALKELKRYPSAIAGIIIILAMVALGIYAIVAIPYNQAIQLWRGGENIWYKTPKLAPPAWINLFRRAKLPDTLILNSAEAENHGGTVTKTMTPGEQETSRILITYTFDFPYSAFPQELALYFAPQYTAKAPHASITWHTPDGREIRVADFSVSKGQVYRFAQDTKLQRRLGGMSPEQGLFVADPKADKPAIVQGRYELRINALTFEQGSDLDAEFVLYGRVYGLAGTDHLRRDLRVALLWGTPVALAFGLIAALGTTLTTMWIAALGTWFGGWVDSLIQRITEVNMVLPFLPILIMIGTFYSRSIWVILGATIILSIFGSGIKTYRAVFLQVKESPYIEAARAYGAGNWRIIFQYLVPRMIPLLIPQLVVLIPSYVFLEAGLAVLGLGDPTLPTWGKVINDAQANGALYQGLYYWVLEPAALLILAGLAFALLGFSLDRIFNPRLREM